MSIAFVRSVRPASTSTGSRLRSSGPVTSQKTGAAPVQHIGKLLVLYRPKVDAEKTSSGKAGKGMRMVTIVKPSASGTKKPSVSKVLLKGNERVTAGGTIKRVKKKVGTKKSVA